MTRLIWTLEKLTKHTRSDDAEVRYWATDRLIRHYPDESADGVAGLLFDDHDLTPSVVARYLGRHGGRKHHAMLVRAFRTLRGQTPGFCLQALIRLDYPGAVDLAGSAVKREDLNDQALALIVEALGTMGIPEARGCVREFLQRRPELLAEPAAMRGAMNVVEVGEIAELLSEFVATLRRRGSHRAGEAFRTVTDVLKIDDTSWCFRTGPSGHVELRKTIKAVESGYDCDISSAIGTATVNQIAHRFRAGNFKEIVRAIADWSMAELAAMPVDASNDLPQRTSAAVEAFARPAVLEDIERLGHQFQQWLIEFQLSTAIAVARRINLPDELKKSQGDLDALLSLAEVETAFLVRELPTAITAVCGEDSGAKRRAEEWCLRMLEAKGPFFPKIVALETLGELGTAHFVSEMMDYLADENSYVYGAAERALSRLGESIIRPAVERVEQADLNPDAAHSLLVLLCDMGSQRAYDAVAEHLDWFMDIVGPGTTAEWVSLFGTEELIEPLRDWLDIDTAAVGQAVLLLAAIHQVPIPEEDEILEAIEAARAQQQQFDPTEDHDIPGGSDGSGGNYVM